MATDLARLVVRMEAQTAKYQKELEKANKKLSGFERRQKKSLANISKGFKVLGTAIAAVGIGRLLGKVTRATAAQEQATAQLAQGLKSTGEAAGFNLQQLLDYATELQRVTTFGDEQLIEASAQLVTFTQLQGDEFKRTLELAGDLSTRFGTDLKSSVIQLGKALNDPIANLSALSRSGIQFSKAQKDLIKSLIETGKAAEAQRVILQELEVQFGGSARAARDTFGGALSGLSNAFGDLLEAKSGLPAAKESLEELTATLSRPETIAAFDAFVTGMVKLSALSASGLTGFVTQIGRIAAFFNDGLVAADDLARVISEKQAEILRLQQTASKSRSNAASNRISELRQEITELQRKFDLINSITELPGADGTGGKKSEQRGAANAPVFKKVPNVTLEELTGKDLDPLKKKTDTAVAMFEEGFKELDGIVNDRTQNMAEGISGALTQGFTGGFDGILQGFTDLIADMLIQWAQSGITSLLTGFLGPGVGAAAGGGGFLSGLLGFNSGGSFMVGGQPGVDSNLVAFRATRGERVTVDAAGQQSASGGAVHIHVNAIDTQSAAQFLNSNRGAIYSAARAAAGDQGRAL